MNATIERQITIVLASLCAVLMLATIAFRLGVGSGYTLAEQSPRALETELLRPLKESKNALPPIEAYAEIGDRPLFSNTRQPLPDTPIKPKGPEAPIVALNVQLAGVVRTRDVDVAILIDKSNSKAIRLKVGQPLPGDQGGWVVKSIEPRQVLFDGGDQGESVVKLDPAASPAAPAPPPPPMRANNAPGEPQPVQTAQTQPGQAPGQPLPVDPGQQAPPPGTPPGNPSTMDPAAREAEIRRIIEERRAQMRAEAEKAGNQ